MTRTRVVGIGVALAIVAIAIVVWTIAHRRPPAVAHPAGPSVALATVTDGWIDVTASAVGRLGPSAGAQSKLAFAVAGRIASIDVHVGQRVRAGEPIAQLDTTGFALAEQQARADAAAAQAQAQGASVDRVGTKLALDERALARARRLYAAGVAARKDVDTAAAQVAMDRADTQTYSAGRTAAQAQAQSADARAAIAARDASNATLRAPSDGVVTAILHNVGESVDPSIPVVAIAPGETGIVTLDVGAADAARIAPGDIVHLQVGTTGTQIDGHVVGVAGAVDPTTQSAQVSVAAHVPVALAGSAVSAEIVVARNRGLLVPVNAIVADPATGKTLVFVQTKAASGATTFSQRDVTVVFQNATTAEVTGLSSGDRIAAQGAFELLSPGSSGG